MRRWTAPIRAVTDLLLPPGCPGCGTAVSTAEGPWCRACADAILAARITDYCNRCGRTAPPYLATAEGCPECRGRRSPLAGLVRVGTYGSIVGTLVKRFKFGREQRLDATLGMLVAAAMQGHMQVDRLDALVPVPTDWRGRWRYRCHPAGLIAHCAGHELGLPVFPLVSLAGKRRRQTELHESERARNVRGAFRLSRHARVAGRTLCVIDDVSTSGATLNEVARVLLEAGASSVYAAVAAKTQLGEDDSPERPASG